VFGEVLCFGMITCNAVEQMVANSLQSWFLAYEIKKNIFRPGLDQIVSY